MKQRVFFAVIPDNATRELLDAAIAPLQADGNPRLRWLERENWHLTLRFVGDVEPSVVAELQDCLDAMTGHGCFQQSLTQLEVFPTAQRPLVVAATGPVHSGARGIVEDLEARCRSLGLPEEGRPWRPHLTLARIRGRRRFEMAPTAIDMSFTVRRLLLMESVASAQGRRYMPIAESSLTAPT